MISIFLTRSINLLALVLASVFTVWEIWALGTHHKAATVTHVSIREPLLGGLVLVVLSTLAGSIAGHFERVPDRYRLGRIFGNSSLVLAGVLIGVILQHFAAVLPDK
jgi:hypothetical protein